MPEHLTYKLQVPRLPEDGRGRVVAQGVRAYLARQTSVDREPVKNVGAVASGETPPPLVDEQVVLRVRVSALREPISKVLRCLRSKEAHSVLLSLPGANVHRPGGEVHVFDSQPEGFADSQAAVCQERHKRPVPAPLEGVKARLEQPADGLVLWNTRERLWRFHAHPAQRTLRQQAGFRTPPEERPELAEV